MHRRVLHKREGAVLRRQLLCAARFIDFDRASHFKRSIRVRRDAWVNFMHISANVTPLGDKGRFSTLVSTVGSECTHEANRSFGGSKLGPVDIRC